MVSVDLAHNKDQYRATVNTVMNFGKFLSNRTTGKVRPLCLITHGAMKKDGDVQV
jgi:hypothetical protein